jgi:hypothetical protein
MRHAILIYFVLVMLLGWWPWNTLLIVIAALWYDGCRFTRSQRSRT